jgi:diacylglycerol kinase family enzyme
MPIDVILNAGAGGRQTGPDAVVAAFAAHGIDARVHAANPGCDLDALLAAICARRPDAVVAAGGDGTVNAVAACLVERPHIALGVLPLGTLNHFARDLEIPTAIDAAVAVIAQGHRVAVDVGEVNGRVFLNNASLGLYATIVAHRDRERRRLGLGKWPAMVRATWAALRNPASFDVAVQANGEQRHWRTPFLFVGNNAYTVQGAALGQRSRLDAGLLSFYVLRPKGRWALLWLGLRALVGAMSRSDDLEALETRELHVDGDRLPVRVARDGEIDELRMPLRFRLRPRALQVYVPTRQEAS